MPTIELDWADEEDPRSWRRVASEHDVLAGVVRPRGPDNWPVVSFTGDEQALRAIVADYLSSDDPAEIDEYMQLTLSEERKMKMTEQQLRSVVKQVLSEAKVDPVDAIKQIQDAAKLIIKLAPMVASELSDVAQEARENEVVGDMADHLDEVSFTLENVPIEFENMVDLLRTYKTVRKVTKQASREKPNPDDYAGPTGYMGSRGRGSYMRAHTKAKKAVRR